MASRARACNSATVSTSTSRPCMSESSRRGRRAPSRVAIPASTETASTVRVRRMMRSVMVIGRVLAGGRLHRRRGRSGVGEGWRAGSPGRRCRAQCRRTGGLQRRAGARRRQRRGMSLHRVRGPVRRVGCWRG
uniref:Uncharacterized protein n=1 Tax=uncultured marine virus TaxID=186617 RepID=A0A0F7L7R6_9VIRU|nr:hypothetical protein [uncultured marine virus]